MQPDILIQELAQGATIFRGLITGVTQAEACVKPEPGSWSILEVLCHLYDEEREDFRQRLDIMLHRPSDPWPPIDPPGWVTARKYNERYLADALDAFLSEREKSLSWLKGLSGADWEAECPTPFGTMKAGAMLASWVVHDTLHTRQLVELRYGRLLQLAAPFDVRYAGEW